MAVPILIFCLVFALGCGGEEEPSSGVEQGPEMVSENLQHVQTDSLRQDSLHIAPSPDISEQVSVERPVVRQDPVFDPGGRYLIQVGAYQNEASARRIMEDLKKMRYPAQVVAEKGVFRVRIGFFKGISEAEALGKRLQQELGLDYWVVNR